MNLAHQPRTTAPTGTPARGRRQRGIVGGIEVLPFGLLIFVGGALLLANVWAVVDAKLAVENAAREAGRAYVEAENPVTAPGAAHQAALQSIEGAGRDPDRLELQVSAPAFQRCAVVEHRTSYRVAAVTIPFLGGFGRGATVHGRHRDVVDPFAAGRGGRGDC